MDDGYAVKTGDNPEEALKGFLKSILARDDVSALLAPVEMPGGASVMPVLAGDPGRLDRARPLSPAFPVSSARLVSRLTRGDSGVRTAAVMRPCEIRAFVELVKLNQGVRENVVIIGADCPGAVTNSGFASAAGDEGLDRRFLEAAVSGDWEGLELSPACRVCEEPTPDGADVLIGLFGGERGEFWATAPTEAGRDLLQGLDLARAARPSGRDEAVSALKESRRTARDRMFSETAEKVSDLPHLTEYLARCTNCLNCRVACPVCYCRECVFTTDVFDHDPARYVAWAERKGAVKMPSDTVFYHLTRLAHIATACVGCGQCSNACPNDIPVMELFRTVSHKAQNDFGYRAGSDPEAPPPLSVFKEDEFGEVVGL